MQQNKVLPLTSKYLKFLYRVEDYPAIHKLFPRAGIKFIPESGHWPHAEKPQEFLDMVTAFLEECLQDHESPDEEET